MLCESASALAFLVSFTFAYGILFHYLTLIREPQTHYYVSFHSQSLVSRGSVSPFRGLNTERERLSWFQTGRWQWGARCHVCGAGQGLPLFRDGVSEKVGVKSTRGGTGGCTLLEFFKVGVPQGRVSGLSCKSA